MAILQNLSHVDGKNRKMHFDVQLGGFTVTLHPKYWGNVIYITNRLSIMYKNFNKFSKIDRIQWKSMHTWVVDNANEKEIKICCFREICVNYFCSSAVYTKQWLSVSKSHKITFYVKMCCSCFGCHPKAHFI